MPRVLESSPPRPATIAEWDAVVIGAGPAGAMAALELARSGVRVLLVEKKRFPRWKVCGACLNGHALAALAAAGLGGLPARSGAIGLRQFHIGFRKRTARLALPAGVALSRAALDVALTEAAVDAGATYVSETQASVGEIRDGLRQVSLTGSGPSSEIAARVVLVATGLGTPRLAASSAAATEVRPGSRIGAGCVVAEAPAWYGDGTIFMAVGSRGYVGAVRVEDGSLNIAAALDQALVRQCGTPGRAAVQILAEADFPPIGGLESTHWQGTAPLTRRTTPIAEERLFLLGDAAGYVEPFTGEGIAWALVAGLAVAPLAIRSIEGWDPSIGAAWSRRYRQLVGRRQVVCRTVALALKHPWVASIGFELAARRRRRRT